MLDSSKLLYYVLSEYLVYLIYFYKKTWDFCQKKQKKNLSHIFFKVIMTLCAILNTVLGYILLVNFEYYIF